MSHEIPVDCPRCEGACVVPDWEHDEVRDVECPACLGQGYLDIDMEDDEE